MNIRREGKVNKDVLQKSAVVFLCLLAVVVPRFLHLSSLYGTIVVEDEIGYWSNAANFLGLGWTEAVTRWYSYGYSFLLAPILALTKNMVLAYRVAVTMNVLLSVGVFFLGMGILKELRQEEKPPIPFTVLALFSLASVSYSSYLFQSDFAWSETLLAFMGYLTTYLGIRFVKRPGVMSGLWYVLATIYMYLVHNRSLPMFIALAMVALAVLFFRKLSGKQWIFVLGVTVLFVVIMVGCNASVKEWLNDRMWSSQAITEDGETAKSLSGNDFSSQQAGLIANLKSGNFLPYLNSFVGKTWYLLTGTFGLAFVGLLGMVIGLFKQKRFSMLVPLLGVLGTLGVAVLSSPVEVVVRMPRLDFLFYGRYFDHMVGLLIITALLYVYEVGEMEAFGMRPRMQRLLAVGLPQMGALCLLAVLALLIKGWLTGIKFWQVNYVCVPAILFSGDYDHGTATCWGLIGGLVFFSLFLAAAGIRNVDGQTAERKQKVSQILLGGIVICFFVLSLCPFLNAYELYTKPLQQDVADNQPFVDFMKDYEEAPLYFSMNRGRLGMDIYGTRLRVQLPCREIIYREPTADRLMGLEGEFLYLTTPERYLQILEGVFEVPVIPEEDYVDEETGELIVTRLLPEYTEEELRDKEQTERENAQKLMPNALVKVVNENYILVAFGEQLVDRFAVSGERIYTKDNVKRLGLEDMSLHIVSTGWEEVPYIEVRYLPLENETYYLNQNPVYLSYHVYDEGGNLLLWDTLRTEIPDGAGDLPVRVELLDEVLLPGETYYVEADAVWEGVSWLSRAYGAEPKARAVISIP